MGGVELPDALPLRHCRAGGGGERREGMGELAARHATDRGRASGVARRGFASAA